ncbi:MAG: hypothetical protein NVSMB13_10900 [Mycobacteriales bacterium]
MVRSGSLMTHDSVISSVSSSGGRPVRLSASTTSWVKVGSSRQRGERLTEIDSGRPAAYHPVAMSTAERSTTDVSGRIRPQRSAREMKESGAMRPRVGCCHRTSASAATIWPEPASACGWR